jgi:tRNA1(Val) A37 N6-methylase TrmN6
VQSSYYTILTALAAAGSNLGARWIDLGSGYGRVGLAIGLLRPDLKIDGYEFVGHRVRLSQTLAEKVGISNKVHFHEQDLSQTDFVIPEAEVYYMYDPFSEETYRHVWNQLQRIGEKKSILIVTKGNAGAWFMKAVEKTNWVGPEIYDTGNVHLFRSRV